VCKTLLQYLWQHRGDYDLQITCSLRRSGNVKDTVENLQKWGTNITHLLFENYEGTRFQIQLYRQILTMGENLQELRFCNCPLQKDPLSVEDLEKHFWDCLDVSCPKLRKISIERLMCGTPDQKEKVRVMIKGIGKMKEIEELELNQCEVLLCEPSASKDKTILWELTKTIEKLQKLKTLDLSGNFFNASANSGNGCDLLRALARHKTLLILKLQGCRLRNEVIEALCRYMGEGQGKIKELHLGINELGPRHRFAEVLSCRNLTVLDLSGNNLFHTSGKMGDAAHHKSEGLEAIILFLEWSEFLKHVNMTGCGLTYSDCEKIIASAKKWIAPKTLYLSYDQKHGFFYTKLSEGPRKVLIQTAPAEYVVTIGNEERLPITDGPGFFLSLLMVMEPRKRN